MSAIVLLLTLTLAQAGTSTSPVEQKTQGTCSPAVADVNGNVTITCTGMDTRSIKDLQRAVNLLQQLVASYNETNTEPISTNFPVEFYLRTSDHLPLMIPARPFPWMAFTANFEEFNTESPDSLQKDSEGRQLYHEFLQKALFEWISQRYFGSWRMERLKFETGLEVFQPTPDATNSKSEILDTAKLEQIFASNRFAKFHQGIGKLALPPGSTLTVSTPKKPEDHGQIRITNPFSEIVIDTAWSFGGRTLGQYGMLLNIDPSANEFWTHSFIVRIRATLSKSLSGYPEMMHIRQWAKDIVEGLQSAFDEQIIRRETIEKYQLELQRVGPNWPRLVIGGLGPMRFAPKEQNQSPEGKQND